MSSRAWGHVAVLAVAVSTAGLAIAQVQTGSAALAGASARTATDMVPLLVDVDSWAYTRQHNFGVEVRRRVQDGELLLAVRAFEMSAAEQATYLWPDSTGAVAPQVPVAATLTVGTDPPQPLWPYAGQLVGSLPLSDLAGDRVALEAFNIHGDRIFFQAVEFDALY